MRNRLFRRKSLSLMSLEERTAALCKTLGVSPSQLSEMAHIGDDQRNEILNAAILVYHRLREQGYEKSFALSHITSGILGLILYPDIPPNQAESRAASNIHFLFSKDRSQIRQDTGVDITSTEVLRVKAFSHVEDRELIINAVRSREVWGNEVRFSSTDLIRGIKLPVILTPYEAAFLGVIYSGASIYPEKCSVRLYGSGKEKDLFTIVREMSNSVLNIDLNNSASSNVFLTSMAVYEWLVKVLGLSKGMGERKAPDFSRLPRDERTDVKQLYEAFLYGILARKGRIYKRKQPYMTIKMNKSVAFLKQVKELSEMLGLSPSLYDDYGSLHFGVKDIEKIRGSQLFSGAFHYKNTGGFFNPLHIQHLS